MKTKISVITICYNEKNAIEKTINSVLEQSYANIEYIIVDGNSTDGTVEIVNKYKEDIDIIISEQDNGIFDAQNKGIKNSSGEYLLILNAGDYFYHSNVLSDMADTIDGNDIIYGDIVFEYSNGIKYRKNSPDNIGYINMYVDTIPHPAILYRADLFKKTGLYDTKYLISADYEHLLKSVFKFGLAYKHIDIPVSVFNLEGISSDSSNKKLFKSERSEIQKSYFPKSVFIILQIFKPILILFCKKFYYLYFYLKSRINKNYMEYN